MKTIAHARRILVASSLVLAASVRAEDPNVHIYGVQVGNKTKVMVRLTHVSEATVSIFTVLKNMKSAPSATTFDVTGQGEHLLLTLTEIDPAQPWHYDWTSSYYLGVRTNAKPRPYRYARPYRTGILIQGPHGTYSHELGGPDAEAYDWSMPIGSPVLAARPGRVVAIRSDSDKGGPDPSLRTATNYVIVRHDDGTYAEYAHIRKGGVKVGLGDTVKRGQLIALSGQTGHASGPHLHFMVYVPTDGGNRKPIPVTFAPSP
jgi:hypothetical protein